MNRIFLIMFLLFFSAAANAAEEKYFLPESLSDSQLIKKENFDEAMKNAETNRDIQFTLGVMYYQGRGLERTPKIALKYFEKASAASDSRAAYDLAYIYRNDIGLGLNPEKALQYTRKAAELGHPKALYDMAIYYEKGGPGVTPDQKNYLDYLNRAYEAGSVEAADRIGLMYTAGQLFKKNPNKAIEIYSYIYNTTPDRKDKIAEALKISAMYQSGKEVAKDEGRGVLWLKRAADLGDEASEINLGTHYRDGKGVEKDYAKALEMFQRAAGEGSLLGEINVAYMYMNGLGVEKNSGIAIEHYKSAANRGSEEAAKTLYDIYFSGIGVKQDQAEADRWLETSRSLHKNEAQPKLPKL